MGDYDAPRVSRRTVLQAGTVLTGAAYLGVWDLSAAKADDALVPPLPGNTADFSFILRRREDFLRLQFDFSNATLQGNEIVRTIGSRPIVMVVGFPTQSLHEEALYETDSEAQGGSGLGAGNTQNDRTAGDPGASEGLKLPGDMGSRMAGVSRLAFTRDVDSVPFTVEALLNWKTWTPNLSPFATQPGTFLPASSTTGATEPAPNQTSLEMPWWLFLSPLPAGRWAHAIDRVTNLGRTELWHTGLVEPPPGQLPGTSPAGPSHIRALWAKDGAFPPYHTPSPQAGPPVPPPSLGEGGDIGTKPGVPFRGPLAPRDRADIVVSSSVHGSVGRGGNGYVPQPVDVDRLMLTSLGGYLDAFGSWEAGAIDENSGTSLESWRHRMSLGRDHYVRIVRKGFLYPFGHRASLIKVTERKFANVDIPQGQLVQKRRVAYLFQRYFIVVREPVKTYNDGAQPDGNWANPFRSIRITSLTTPVLDPPVNDLNIPGSNPPEIFTPKVAGAPFRFQMQGTDRAGKVHSFTAAAPFVLLDVAFDPGDMGALNAAYGGQDAEGDLRASDLGGATVFMVDPDVVPQDGKPEHGAVKIAAITWAPVPGGENAGDPSTDRPAFFPRMDYARLNLDAVEAVAGGSLGAAGVPFRYRQQYVDNDGYTSNPSAGLVFLEQHAAAGAPPVADFATNGTDRTGGSINPGFTPSNFNLQKGCAGGDPAMADADDFDPAAIFGGVGKFLGDLALDALLRPAKFSDEDSLEIASVREDSAVVTTMHFRSAMKSFPSANSPIFIAGRGKELPSGEEDDTFPDGNSELTIDVRIVTPYDGSEATYHVRGEVRDFQIRLFGGSPFIQIAMKSAKFEVNPGQKPSFDVELADVFFPDESPLKMVADIVTAFLSDSPFFIDLQPTSVEAGLDLRLPTITLGALQLKNLGIFFSVKIPFLGDPVLVTFGIGSRDKPVAVTYMALGGGFWVTLLLTANGVKGFELGIEVRASLEGSIGPFKAYAEIAVGIIIAIDESNGGECVLTGYFRAKAGVSLVVVSIKIQIEMSLTYIPSQEKAIGKVSVLIEVEIVFFSISVSVEYERKFGGGSDPVFGDVYPASLPDGSESADFDEYINLFAGVPA